MVFLWRFPYFPVFSSGWWFGTFFIFPYIHNNHPNWLIFFRGVETTNQSYIFLQFFDGFPPLEPQPLHCRSNLGQGCNWQIQDGQGALTGHWHQQITGVFYVVLYGFYVVQGFNSFYLGDPVVRQFRWTDGRAPNGRFEHLSTGLLPLILGKSLAWELDSWW